MKMDTKKHSSSSSSTQGDEEDYIDIEVSTSKNSSPQSREFEFQSQILFSTSQDEKDTSPSPADELFYKGNLLPLHLPRRLQMVRKILENSAPPTITTSTPMDSSNVSPSESCRVSCELHPDEYVFHWSTDLLSTTNTNKYFQQQQPKKCWSKKLKLIKELLLAQKLKASRLLYFKSLFNKSTCSENESSFPATDEKQPGSKIRDLLNNSYNNAKYLKFGKENPFEESVEDVNTGHRKSFSGAIKRHCSAKCISGFSSSLSTSSSSTVSSCSTFSGTFHSNKSSGFYELKLDNKSCNKYSSDSEVEKAIEGAIAHCKKSQEKQCFSKYNHSINHSLIQR